MSNCKCLLLLVFFVFSTNGATIRATDAITLGFCTEIRPESIGSSPGTQKCPKTAKKNRICINPYVVFYKVAKSMPSTISACLKNADAYCLESYCIQCQSNGIAEAMNNAMDFSVQKNMKTKCNIIAQICMS